MQIDTTSFQKTQVLPGQLHAGTQPQKAPSDSPQEQFGTGLLSPSSEDNGGCCGVVNPIDMDEFMAAWGSDDAEFDLDNTGVVDGADLALFLGLGAMQSTDVVSQIEDAWGSPGDTTTDINGDQAVDGMDLTLALASLSDGDEIPAPSSQSLPPVEAQLKPLHALLDNWGTEASESDFNGDGLVNGHDLALQLGNASATDRSLNFDNGFRAGAYADRLVEIFGKMGFKDAPPSNLGEVIDGLNLPPVNAKTLSIELLDQYKKS